MKMNRTAHAALTGAGLSLRDHVRLSAPELEVLKTVGEESEAKGTDKLSPRQIDKIIRETRAKREFRATTQTQDRKAQR